jgi:DNA-binding GntR family transcriptional regulator
MDKAKTVRSRSIAAKVYEQLRSAILSREYPPGSILTETDLAERFGCSNTPVREVLRSLQAEGLVEVIPFKGYLVTQASLRDVQELLELRAGLEGYAAELAASRATERELDQLKLLASQTFIRGDEESYIAYQGVNREFHLAVARAARNQQILGLIESTFDQLQRLLYEDLHMVEPGEAGKEHQGLVEAMRLRRPTQARRIMTMQVLRTGERLLIGLK